MLIQIKKGLNIQKMCYHISNIILVIVNKMIVGNIMFVKIKKDIQVNHTFMSKLICVNYRFGNFVVSLKIPIIRQILMLFFLFGDVFVRIVSKCEIPASCSIGKGLRLEHRGNGVIIHSQAKIGDNLRLFHQVTIGTDEKNNVPEIGNGVYIGAGAKIIGKVKIGDNAKIGANAVVTKDVPENTTFAGVPAKYIKTHKGVLAHVTKFSDIKK